MQASTSGPGAGVVAPGARLEKLAGGFEFTEGPTCDADGNIFFTDQPSNRILKWSADGELSTFLQPAGRANGMYFDPSGHLIACADEGNALWSIAPDGTVSVIAAEYGGKLLNGPNDVWVRSDGAIYFTDPFYKRSWWTHDTMPQDGQHVYFLSKERRGLVRVAADLEKPNGIIGSPDGKRLYVSDISAGSTYRYDIAPDGDLAGRTLAAAHGSDIPEPDTRGGSVLVEAIAVGVCGTDGGRTVGLPAADVASNSCCATTWLLYRPHRYDLAPTQEATRPEECSHGYPIEGRWPSARGRGHRKAHAR